MATLTSKEIDRLRELGLMSRPAADIILELDSQLAAAREWIENIPHQDECPWRLYYGDTSTLTPHCTCGRDALLKKLEVPK